ncbi:hypothetical protein JCM19992_25190 [Thermostilla marina]
MDIFQVQIAEGEDVFHLFAACDHAEIVARVVEHFFRPCLCPSRLRAEQAKYGEKAKTGEHVETSLYRGGMKQYHVPAGDDPGPKGPSDESVAKGQTPLVYLGIVLRCESAVKRACGVVPVKKQTDGGSATVPPSVRHVGWEAGAIS